MGTAGWKSVGRSSCDEDGVCWRGMLFEPETFIDFTISSNEKLNITKIN